MPGGPDRQFTFAFDKLADAIRLTFKQRSTELAEPIDAFSEAFTSPVNRSGLPSADA